MSNQLRPFHLAIPVDNLDVCRKFYRDTLELSEGRSSDHWVDFDFFGHQLVIHLKEKNSEEEIINPVDGKNVPIPHFGVVLDMKTFKNFSEKLIQKNITFIIEPYIRFEGQVGERSEEHTSELQSRENLVCRLLLEKKKKDTTTKR